MAEVAALQAVRREVLGSGFDAVLLVPAFLEAGRLTAADIHWARIGPGLVPVGETEFARDPAFGYAASDLRDFVAEKSGGAIGRDDVRSISLADIRLGGGAAGPRAAGRRSGRHVGRRQRHRILRPGDGGVRRCCWPSARASRFCSAPGRRSCAP